MIDRVVHLKGQIALDKDGEVVAKGDMREAFLKTADIRRRFSRRRFR